MRRFDPPFHAVKKNTGTSMNGKWIKAPAHEHNWGQWLASGTRGRRYRYCKYKLCRRRQYRAAL